MVSRYASNPNCGDCGKKKGPNQLNGLRCYTCKRAADKASKDAKHTTHIETIYGISKQLYNLLYAFQGGRCYICRKGMGKTRRLSVDHDHHCQEGHASNVGCSKCVRGLLDATCNTFLGRMRDNPEVGDRFAAYLRDPPFQRMLRSMN